MRDEFLRLAQRQDRFHGLALPDWIRCSAPVAIGSSVAACPGLDRGEAEALALAHHLGAEYVLLDDQAARAAAIMLKQRFTGIAGILLRAKTAGAVAAVAPLLDRLRSEAGFFLAKEFHTEVLRLAGENPGA